MTNLCQVEKLIRSPIHHQRVTLNLNDLNNFYNVYEWSVGI